jgi:hypothetical protein
MCSVDVRVRNFSDRPANNVRIGVGAWDHEARSGNSSYGRVEVTARIGAVTSRGRGYVRIRTTVPAGQAIRLHVTAHEPVPDPGREGGIDLTTFTSLNKKFGYSYPHLQIYWDGDPCASVWEDDESCA